QGSVQPRGRGRHPHRRLLYFARVGQYLIGVAGDGGDRIGDLLGTGRGLVHRPGDIGGGRGLLLDRGGDRRLALVDPFDDVGDAGEDLGGRGGVPLDAGHACSDVLGGGGALGGQLLDLTGDD